MVEYWYLESKWKKINYGKCGKRVDAKSNAVLLNLEPSQLSTLLLKNAQIQKLSNLHINDNKIAIFQLSGKLKGDN